MNILLKTGKHCCKTKLTHCEHCISVWNPLYDLSCFTANGLFDVDVENYMLSHFLLFYLTHRGNIVWPPVTKTVALFKKKDIARKNATMDGCNLNRNDPAYLVFWMFLIAIAGCFLIT